MALRSTSETQLADAWAAARDRLAREPDVSTLELQQEARARGAGFHDSEIASQLAMDRLLQRYGGVDGQQRLESLGLTPEALHRLTVSIDPFRGHVFGERPADTVENRLHALITSRRIDVAAQIKADVALVKQSESDDVPARARFLLDKQAREASGRLEAISILLGVPRDALIRAADERSIHPERADALIEQVYGSHLPEGTPFDRAQKTIRPVSADAFREHYRSISGADDARVDRLPLLVAGNAILVPIDEARFGSGAIASIALLQYAHPELDEKLGSLLSAGLADHLASRLNETFGPRETVIESGVAHGGGQIWPAVEKLIGREALVEGFFQDPGKLYRTLEERFGGSVFERLAERAARCFSDIGYVLGRSEIEALLRDQERLVASAKSGVETNDPLEEIQVLLARAPQTERKSAATEHARSLGAKGLAALSDRALALLASLPLRSEELYCFAEGKGAGFLERHDLGYAFRQLQRQQEGEVNARGLELLESEVRRRSEAKRGALAGAEKVSPDFLQQFVASLPALEAALGRHLQGVDAKALSNARTISSSELVWLDPTGEASERKLLLLDRAGDGPRVFFAEDAGLEAIVDAWLALNVSPELAKNFGAEIAQLALDQFSALRLDHLLPQDADLFLNAPVRLGSPNAARVFHALDDAVEASVRRELGAGADLSAIQRATADRWAQILFAGDLSSLQSR